MKLLDVIVGSEDQNTINQRILKTVIFFTAAFTIYVFIGGFFAGQGWGVQAPILGIIVVFITIYTLSRMHLYPKVIRPVYITFGLLSICLYYFILNGIRGEIPMYFILGAMLSITIVKRRYYLFVIAV